MWDRAHHRLTPHFIPFAVQKAPSLPDPRLPEVSGPGHTLPPPVPRSAGGRPVTCSALRRHTVPSGSTCRWWMTCWWPGRARTGTCSPPGTLLAGSTCGEAAQRSGTHFVGTSPAPAVAFPRGASPRPLPEPSSGAEPRSGRGCPRPRGSPAGHLLGAHRRRLPGSAGPRGKRRGRGRLPGRAGPGRERRSAGGRRRRRGHGGGPRAGPRAAAAALRRRHLLPPAAAALPCLRPPPARSRPGRGPRAPPLPLPTRAPPAPGAPPAARSRLLPRVGAAGGCVQREGAGGGTAPLSPWRCLSFRGYDGRADLHVGITNGDGKMWLGAAMWAPDPSLCALCTPPPEVTGVLQPPLPP